MDIHGPLAAVLVAVGMNILNTAIGYAIAKWSFEKDLNVFLAIVFGSFAVRASVVVACIWLLLSVLGMDLVWFSIAFAISSFVSLMAEIIFFHRSIEKAKRRRYRPAVELLKKKVIEAFKFIEYFSAAPAFRLLHEY